ncbi:ABC transporter ATP-binding protein [Pediococcus damnosus]|uniref:metal ABC transporter ATP-binding protein n=1 Tax=Pediococcus damnosus TaxID=51663 RepID=UPI000C1CB426|nr:ATP-binding cassette domain-containing protein [Pediococcus damnosus]PIO81589.1 ABC transporter ATP-binding protein [Pediococcus damnosus]
MSEPVLDIKNLTVAFPDHLVLNDLSVQLNKGDFLSVVGQNGVGKTTLVRVILHQLAPQKGSVTYTPNFKQMKIGYVPQFRNIDEEYPLSIRDFVGLNLHDSHLSWLSKNERKKLNRIIKDTNLESIQNTPLGEASGGEKQKAYLAQALINDPDLLILDESTASLDSVRKFELLDLVQKFNVHQNVSVLFITHDIELAQKYANQYLLMRHGSYESGPISQFKEADLEEAEHA